MPHPFEDAGLGTAPFTLDDYRKVASGAKCEFCGQPINRVFVVLSSDGRRFGVGSDCVFKTNDNMLQGAVKGKIAELKSLDDEQRIANAVSLLGRPEVLTALDKVSSPAPLGAKKGETAKVWCEWMMQNSEKTGKLKVAKFLEQFEFGE